MLAEFWDDDVGASLYEPLTLPFVNAFATHFIRSHTDGDTIDCLGVFNFHESIAKACKFTAM